MRVGASTFRVLPDGRPRPSVLRRDRSPALRRSERRSTQGQCHARAACEVRALSGDPAPRMARVRFPLAGARRAASADLSISGGWWLSSSRPPSSDSRTLRPGRTRRGRASAGEIDLAADDKSLADKSSSHASTREPVCPAEVNPGGCDRGETAGRGFRRASLICQRSRRRRSGTSLTVRGEQPTSRPSQVTRVGSSSERSRVLSATPRVTP